MEYKESFYNIWQQKDQNIYLLNTYTNALIKLNSAFEKNIVDNIFSNIENIQIYLSENKNSNNYFEKLCNNGFLIPKNFDEQKILKYKYNSVHFSTNFISITLLFTLRCNFSCPYCFETEKSLKMTNEDFEKLKIFSKKYFKFKKNVHIGLFGGEPLLEWNKICNYFDYIFKLKEQYKFKLKWGITTNGYLLDEDRIDKLINIYKCNGFQITFDGYKKTHNATRKLLNSKKETYNIILRNFKSLIQVNKIKNNELNLNLRINLLNTTIEEIKLLLNEFSDDEKKYFYIYFRPIYNTDKFCVGNKNSSNLEVFYQLARDLNFKIKSNIKKTYSYCEGDSGKNVIEIIPDLSVWKCMNDPSCDIANIGKITEDGNLKYDINKLEKWSRNNPFDDTKCKECKYLPLCFGGCPLVFYKTGKRTCFYEKNFSILDLFLDKLKK